MTSSITTKIYCLDGTPQCLALIENIKAFGLNVNITCPNVSPNMCTITSNNQQSEEYEEFLKTIENNPRYYIFYDIKSDKCKKDVFRVNVVTSTTGGSDKLIELDNQQLRYIPNVPSTIIPPAMRDFYAFPVTQPSADLRPKIGVISLGGYFNPLDFQLYWTKCGFTTVRPIIIEHVVAGHIMPVFGKDTESLENTLDIELIGGFCQSAEIHFYSAPNTDTGYYDAFEMAINQQMDIISTSWGQSEENFYGLPAILLPIYDNLFYRGVTGKDRTNGDIQVSDHYTIITGATGDYGSSDNNYKEYKVNGIMVPVPHADFPSTSPWVVACGGTSLYLDLELDPSIRDKETGWIYGGGGQSSFFRRPDYQQKNTPWKSVWPVSPLCYKEGGQPYARTTPDVVFNADPNSPWYIIFNQYVDQGSGTSVSAPIMAALLGEFYVASKPDTAPRNGYFGAGFNFNLYRSPSSSIKRIFYGYNVTVDRDPITDKPNPYGLILDQPNTFYYIWESDTVYTFCCGKGVVIGKQMIAFLNTIVCVIRGTNILLSSGQSKPIEQIVRGDVVVGYQNKQYMVADINKQYISKNCPIDMMEFAPNSIGEQIPNQKLFITHNHPIFHQNYRTPAKFFNNPQIGIIEHKSIKPKELMEPESLDESGPVYCLYDLQFEEDGSYIANGVTVQSRSPWSDITPLEKEMYFDQTKYQDQRHWDSLFHELPLGGEAPHSPPSGDS